MLSTLADCLSQINDWLSNNYLYLNSSKTKTIGIYNYSSSQTTFKKFVKRLLPFASVFVQFSVCNPDIIFDSALCFN